MSEWIVFHFNWVALGGFSYSCCILAKELRSWRRRRRRANWVWPSGKSFIFRAIFESTPGCSNQEVSTTNCDLEKIHALISAALRRKLHSNLFYPKGSKSNKYIFFIALCPIDAFRPPMIWQRDKSVFTPSFKMYGSCKIRKIMRKTLWMLIGWWWVWVDGLFGLKVCVGWRGGCEVEGVYWLWVVVVLIWAG